MLKGLLLFAAGWAIGARPAWLFGADEQQDPVKALVSRYEARVQGLENMTPQERAQYVIELWSQLSQRVAPYLTQILSATVDQAQAILDQLANQPVAFSPETQAAMARAGVAR